MSGKPDLNDIEFKTQYSMSKAYGISKLYMIWVMRHFVSEMKKAAISNITFNSVHPASAPTSLGRESTRSLKYRVIYYLWKPTMISVVKGASSSIKAATSPELEGVTGKYYGPKGEEKVSEKYYSEENEKIVWDYCNKVIKPFLF